MFSLEEFGFDAVHYAEVLGTLDSDETVGRVVTIERGRHLVITAQGPVWRTWPHRPNRSPAELGPPAVGDWVLGHGARTVRILPRRTTLARKAPGPRSSPQMIAANIDCVFVMTAVGGDFSRRRLERYVALVHAGGARPIIVVNKTDQPFDVVETMCALDDAAAQIPICMISARDHQLDDLAPYLTPRSTIALIGSSGVGKSTLVNRLLNSQRQTTGEVREHDQTGRHTTTRRELIRLDSGVLLIDTPGLREVGLIGQPDALGSAFEDIAQLTEQCRFTDCRHTDEPGCAIRAALENGRLSEDRWRSHERLRREMEYEAQRADARVRIDTKVRWKQIHKNMRARKKIDPKRQ